MTQASLPQLPDFIRAAATAPDAARAVNPPSEPGNNDQGVSVRQPTNLSGFERQPPDYRPRLMDPDPAMARHHFDLDTAIEMNRRSTPQSVVDKRSASRYSLSEINTMSLDQITERIQQQKPGDDRPTWIKFLDIIDAPRNFVAKNISDIFLPEAKRMALERGEFDQLGQVKVYGADLLRAMGIENKIVNAIGGLAVDIFTDPISFLGGPIGGLKAVGTHGAVNLSTKGGRVLRSSIKAAAKGKTITDDAARDLIENHLAWGRAAGELAEETPEAIESFLSKTIYGDRGRVSRTLSQAGLGGRTRGGTLAEDFVAGVDDALQAADPALEAARVARIRSTQKFIAKHTNNPGLNRAADGGFEALHLPFTTQTLTINPIGNLGREAVVQKAIAQAGLGKAAGGASIIRAHEELTKISAITGKIERFFGETAATRRAGGDPEMSQDAAQAFTDLADWIEEAQKRRIADHQGLEEIEDIPTLAATARMHELAGAELRKATALIEQRDVDNVIGRFSKEDIAAAKEFRNIIASEAKAKLNLDPQTVFDALADPARANAALRDIIETHRARANHRVDAILDLADTDLDVAESLIDSFQAVSDAAADVARLRGHQLHKALDAENALLADAARRIVGIDRSALGAVPFTKLETAFRNLAPDWASWINDRGYGVATNFGGVNGTTQSILQSLRRVAAGSGDYGNEVARRYLYGGGGFSKGLSKIARDAGIHRSDANAYQMLDQLVSARVEAKLRAASGMRGYVRNAGPGSKAEQFIKQVERSGVLKDDIVRQDIDTLVDEMVAFYQQLGAEMVARGEIDNPIQAYMNVRLGDDAERAARARQKAERGQPIAAADRGGQGQLDPTEGRATNLVEFTDARGNAHRFLLFEHDWASGINADDITKLRLTGDPDDARTADYIEQLQRSFAAFEDTFGTGDNVRDRMALTSQPLMPWELNDYSETHALDGLTGGPLADGSSMWETSAMALLNHRSRSARAAEAQAAFREIIEPHILLNVPVQQHKALVKGKAIVTSDGTQIEALGDGRYLHGGTVYRHIDDAKFDADSAFVPSLMLGDNARDALIPEQLAVAMERMNQVLKPDNMPAIMRMADYTTSLFKVSTLLHPSWFVGNTTGNSLLSALMRPELLTPQGFKQYAGMFKVAIRALSKYKLGTLDLDEIVRVGGQDWRIGDLLELSRENGVETGGVAGDFMSQVLGRRGRETDVIAPAESASRINRIQTRFGAARRDALAELARVHGAHAGETPSRLDQLRATAKASKRGVLNSVFGAWANVNGLNDDGFRFAMFLTLLDDGMDPIAAGERVRRGLLNFGDMSNFERNYIRPLVPFYAWTRASLPNFLMRTFREPQHVAAVPKLVTALEEALAGEDRVPRWQRPSWLNETLAIQATEDAETSFLAGTLFPQEGAVQAIGGALGAVGSLGIPTGFDGTDFMATMNWLYGQTAPVVKVPTELAFGRESFTGREISSVEGAGDISTKDYLLGQVRWLRETGIGQDRTSGLERAAERGPGAVAGRLLVGGRFSDALAPENRERAFFFDLREEEGRIRKAIRKNEGDAERQDDLRVELMAIYKHHIERGGNPDDIPKWARQELADLGVL